MQNNDTNATFSGNQSIWENLYFNGKKVNRYPYDSIVSFVFRHFGSAEKENINILDYGCGGGGNSHFLAREGFNVYCIDYSISAVAITDQMLCEQSKDYRYQSIVADFKQLPFKNASFDAIIDRQSLGQNSSIFLPTLVKELYRALKPGGLYYGINFADSHPQLQFGEHLGGNDYGKFNSGVFKNIGHRHFFSETEITELFSNFKIDTLNLKSNISALDSNIGSVEFEIIAQKT